MACFGMPPELSMTVAVLSTGTNIWLGTREFEIYKDQRVKLNELTDVNIERGEKLHGFDKQVKALHEGVNSAINGVPTFSGCCEDAERIIPSIVSRQAFDYVDALDEMSGYQAGLKQALYARVARVVGKAVAQQAAVFNRDQTMEWQSIASKNSLIAGSSSPHNAHTLMSTTLGQLAINAGERLNTASTLFSGLTREAFREIGFVVGQLNSNRERTIDDGGLFVATNTGNENLFQSSSTPISFGNNIGQTGRSAIFR